MKYRKLGKSELNVCEVGLGCWQFGGDFGEMTRDTAFNIMEAAVARGVNFFDTADVYGGGISEQWIGEFSATTSQPMVVATKFGRDGSVYPDQYSEATLRASIAASAERLGVERIDLLQLHCIPTEVLYASEIFDWLRKVQEEGLISHFGASVETVEEGLFCLKQEGLASLQVIFNLFRQKLVDELLPQAQQQGVGIIVRLPLASGLLTGKFSAETTFAATDHRNFNRDGQCFNVGETFAGLPFEKGIELTRQLQALLPPAEEVPLSQLALRWILDHPAVSVVIPGASSPQQVEKNVAASALAPLNATQNETLRDFYQEHVHEHIRGAY
ncbi:MAG: aldo/keto reductase [Verrucomicrobiota bacterium]